MLEGSVECHTCLLDVCPHDNLCMKQIAVHEVLDAAQSILQMKDAARQSAQTNTEQAASQ